MSSSSVHIRIDAIAWLYLILSQRESLPFCQRMYHLGTCLAQVLDGEGDGTLHTVQVVVDTKSLKYEKWSCDTTQAQLRREVLLEKLFDQLDALLRLTHVEQALVVYGFNDLTHGLFTILSAKVTI